MAQNENSKLHMLEDMATSMQESIDNIEKVINETNALIAIVSPANDGMFDDFIGGLKTQIAQYTQQQQKLTLKRSALNQALLICSNDELAEKAVNSLLDALSVFDA